MAKGEKIATNMLGRHATIWIPSNQIAKFWKKEDPRTGLIHVVVEVVNVYLSEGTPEYTGRLVDYAENPSSTLFLMSERTKEIHGKLVTFWNDNVTALAV